MSSLIIPSRKLWRPREWLGLLTGGKRPMKSDGKWINTSDGGWPISNGSTCDGCCEPPSVPITDICCGTGSPPFGTSGKCKATFSGVTMNCGCVCGIIHGAARDVRYSSGTLNAVHCQVGGPQGGPFSFCGYVMGTSINYIFSNDSGDCSSCSNNAGTDSIGSIGVKVYTNGDVVVSVVRTSNGFGGFILFEGTGTIASPCGNSVVVDNVWTSCGYIGSARPDIHVSHTFVVGHSGSVLLEFGDTTLCTP